MEVALSTTSPWTPVDVELSLHMEGGATQPTPSTTYYLIITLHKSTSFLFPFPSSPCMYPSGKGRSAPRRTSSSSRWTRWFRWGKSLATPQLTELQEIWDSARRISCQWEDTYRKSIRFAAVVLVLVISSYQVLFEKGK